MFEAYEVVLERMERDVAAAGDGGRARLDAAVSTVILSNLHSEWAQLASQVALRELGRLDEADRAKVAATRDRMVDVIEAAIKAGVKAGDFTTRDTRVAALAVLGLCLSVIELYPEMDRPLPAVVELYQRFAVALASTPAAAKPKRKRKPTQPS